ncbi:MAG TPA: cytochrome c oxidase subunit 4 [Candidatus Baltobacteraceae bacterium]|nr:cytochrome c oxidase subunit 4 [Candidatus Baltobacteraceae bacterium]
MTVGRRLFVSSAIFGIVIAVAYWFSAHNPDGTILLGLMATALVFAAGYMFVAEREARLVGDRSNASSVEASGEQLGVFTVASPWPIVVAFSVFLLLLGLAIYPVLAAFGLALLLFGLFRLGRESR